MNNTPFGGEMPLVGTDADDVTPEPVDDNTADLQRLIAVGHELPRGVWSFSRPLLVDQNGLIGSGRQLTRLVYTGPPRDDGCISIKGGSWGFKLAGFDLSNADNSRQGVGIYAGYEPVSGTQSGGATWDRISVSGFDAGVGLGRWDGGATSEHLIQNCEVSNCNTGWRFVQWNTLNLIFDLPGLMNCDLGIDGGQAGSIHITGGSATQVKTVLQFRVCGTFSTRGFRTEGRGRFLDTYPTTARKKIAVSDLTISGSNNTDGIDIFVQWGDSLAVYDSLLAGKIVYNPTDETNNKEGFGSVRLEGVDTRGPVLLDAPIGCKLRHIVRDCALLNSGNEVAKLLDADKSVFTGPVK